MNDKNKMKNKKIKIKRHIVLMTILICMLTNIQLYKKSTAAEYRWISAKSGLRMRHKPSLKGVKIDLVPYGEKIILISETGKTTTISGATGKWSLIDWKNKRGWVFGGYLSKSEITVKKGPKGPGATFNETLIYGNWFEDHDCTGFLYIIKKNGECIYSEPAGGSGEWEKTGKRTYRFYYSGIEMGPAGEVIDDPEKWTEKWTIISITKKELKVKYFTNRDGEHRSSIRIFYRCDGR